MSLRPRIFRTGFALFFAVAIVLIGSASDVSSQSNPIDQTLGKFEKLIEQGRYKEAAPFVPLLLKFANRNNSESDLRTVAALNAVGEFYWLHTGQSLK